MHQPSPTSSSSPSFVIWQMMDSNLPTGGFAHSYGLEAALQLGQYHLQADEDEETRINGLMAFCRHALKQQALLLLPLVQAAYHEAEMAGRAAAAAAAAAVAYSPPPNGPTSSSSSVSTSSSTSSKLSVLLEAWGTLDRQCQALVTTEGGRRASIAQGQALLRLACDAFPTIPPSHREALRQVRGLIRHAGREHHHHQQQQQRQRQQQQQGKDDATEEEEEQEEEQGIKQRQEVVPPSLVVPVKGHHPPLFGWLCCALGIDEVTTGRMFLYLVLRDVMAAATRLGLVGPLLAVRLQMSLYRDADEVLEQLDRMESSEDNGGALERNPDETCQRRRNLRPPRQDNPLLDILQGAHEKLYSRLFIS